MAKSDLGWNVYQRKLSGSVLFYVHSVVQTFENICKTSDFFLFPCSLYVVVFCFLFLRHFGKHLTKLQLAAMTLILMKSCFFVIACVISNKQTLFLE